MPGLSQLKKFTADMREVGDEVNKRTERGEPIITLSLPSDVPLENDSEDFIFGLPTEETMAITSKEANIDDDLKSLQSSSETAGEIDPDLARLLEQYPSETSTAESFDFETSLSKAPSTEDFSLTDTDSAYDFSDNVEELEELEELAEGEETDSLEDISSDSFEIPAEIVIDKDTSDLETKLNFDDFEKIEDFDVKDLTPVEEFNSNKEEISEDILTEFSKLEPESFDLPDNSVSTMTDSEYEPPADPFAGTEMPMFDNEQVIELDATDEQGEIEDAHVLGFDMPDFGSGISESEQSISGDDFAVPNFDDQAAESSFETEPFVEAESLDSHSMPILSGNEQLDSIDDSFFSKVHSDVNFDNFDTTDGMLASEAESEEMDEEFSLPDLDIYGKSGIAFTGSTSETPGEEGHRDSLTDAEYEVFKKNFAEYPLNLRIAIEEIIVNDEFTEVAVFGVIEKILKRVSARQLSRYIEKYLDIVIDIPRDFERRTVVQYENYKQSLQYQLKNRIIPTIIAGVILISFVVVVSIFGTKFVYKPMAAEKAYKEGYVSLENNMYQQAEIKFAQAVNLKPKKKWFFKYAHGYREHKQYDRAREKYELLLKLFKQDKNAGLEYADMEFLDLENYAQAENILKRKVLDFHINDKDAILKLGDVYLEWATEKDPSKYEEALHKYNELIEMYGSTNLYISRKMRYYIRTDQLKKVLPLKQYFYAKKNKDLTSQDLLELSGYLMEKLYGPLLSTEEYLRPQIEDVRFLLESAIKADVSVPEAHYNMGKYFVYTGNVDGAISRFNIALDRFDKAETRRKSRVYKHIDTYRLLGEMKVEKQEFISAEEAYGKGIEMFEYENKYSNLASVSNVGKMYANLGDIDYFISGHLDASLYNYEKALECKYSVPQVFYKIGYIHYYHENFDDALKAFSKTVDEKTEDTNALFALANTFALRDNQAAANGCYKQLLDIVELQKAQHRVLMPQVRHDQYELVDMYMKTSNNLGVTMVNLSSRTGDISKISKAMVHFAEANRAYDALTRNQETLVRLEGSNLAAQNIKYVTSSRSGFKPALYTGISRVLNGEKILKQDFVK
ncbi:MAG: hypothetical protein GX220_02510 [Treponema sp.]|nr:hypothetical protein [Treponema sp.]